MTEKESPLKFWQDEHGKWCWALRTSGDAFESARQFSSRPAAVNDFLLLITLGNAEIARALQAGEPL